MTLEEYLAARSALEEAVTLAQDALATFDSTTARPPGVFHRLTATITRIFSSPEHTITLGLTWEPSPDAYKYRIDLLNGSAAPEATTEVTETEVSGLFSDSLTSGNFYVKIFAVNENGDERENEDGQWLFNV